MIRSSRRRKPIPWGPIVGIAASFIAIVAVIAAVAYSLIWKDKDTLDAMLCPKGSGPLGQVVLLVDKSDPLSFTQRKSFEETYKDLVLNHAPKGHLLSVYALADDFAATAEPLLELCNPGNGDDAGKYTENKRQLKERFDRKYFQPLMDLRGQLVTERPGKASPILEMIQLVSITGFQRRAVDGERRLIIVSDMIHHTPQLSMYSGIPDYGEFVGSPLGIKVQAKLKDVKVEFRMLMNAPRVQSGPAAERLLDFWRAHIKAGGGRFVAHEPI